MTCSRIVTLNGVCIITHWAASRASFLSAPDSECFYLIDISKTNLSTFVPVKIIQVTSNACSITSRFLSTRQTDTCLELALSTHSSSAYTSDPFYLFSTSKIEALTVFQVCHSLSHAGNFAMNALPIQLTDSFQN